MADLPYVIVPKDTLKLAMDALAPFANFCEAITQEDGWSELDDIGLWFEDTLLERVSVGEFRRTLEMLRALGGAMDTSAVSLDEIVGVLEPFADAANILDDALSLVKTGRQAQFHEDCQKARSLLHRLKAQTEDNKEGV
jgi:hypothetical protein